MIAALYVDPRGPYPKMPGLDCWDATRDANKYDGTGPIVAHPPCGPWSTMRHLYQGAEHACAPRALELVRKLGGVLEHPANSKLWDVYGLPRPVGDPAQPGMVYSGTDSHGFTIQVDQCDWGHVARKRTWLYVVGVDWLEVARLYDRRPFPGAVPTHWASGSRGNTSRKGSPVPPGIKVCSAAQRRKTPPLFASFLVGLAGMAAPITPPFAV